MSIAGNELRFTEEKIEHNFIVLKRMVLNNFDYE